MLGMRLEGEEELRRSSNNLSSILSRETAVGMVIMDSETLLRKSLIDDGEGNTIVHQFTS